MNIHHATPKKGFTLIELIITVAIVALLASIAYPVYTDQVIKGNRSAAQQFILEVANRQELYLSDNRQYAVGSSALTTLGLSLPDKVNTYYTITIGPNTATVPPTYAITATPKSGTMQSNDFTLTLNNLGVKTPTGKW